MRRMHDLAELHVRRRKAQRAPALLAMLHDAIERPQPAKPARRLVHVARSIAVRMREDETFSPPACTSATMFTSKPSSAPMPLQAVHIAHPSLAEPEVEPDADAARANLAHDHALAELAIRHRRHHGVEPQEMQLLARRAGREQSVAAAGVISRKGGASGWKCRRGAGSNVATPSGAPRRFADSPCTFDNGAMAGVQAVEIAQRDCCAFRHAPIRSCRTEP